MFEESWDRRPYGIQAFAHVRAAPQWASPEAATDKLDERPISVCTTLSELRFVSDEGGDIAGPLNPEPRLSPCSPISQIHFASSEETMALISPIECELPSRGSSLSFSPTDSSSSGIHKEQTRTVLNEKFSSTKHTGSASPQQPGCAISKLNGSAILDPKRVGKRPLPEVPGHVHSRPLPPRPIKMATVPGWRDFGRFSYPPHRQFVQDCSKDPLAASRPTSDSGPDTMSQLVREERPNHGPTSEDARPTYYRPAPPTMISLPAASPSPSLSPPPSPALPLRPVPLRSSTDLLSLSSIDLVTAAGLAITDVHGQQIPFGALFRDCKAVVILIRYFWCLCCQDYVRKIMNSVTPEILEHNGVDLVLIGNGSPKAIKVYKRILKVPFKVYTDPSLQLYEALGLYTTSNVQTEGLREGGRGRSHSKRGGRWTSLRIALRAAAAKPLHNNIEQLGGEFIFGPGLKSSFVHKMRDPGDHAPVAEVLEAAGVEVREKVLTKPSSTKSMFDALDIDITINASTPELPPTPASIAISFAPITFATPMAFTPNDGEDIRLGSEPPTPIIPDEGEWMVHRTESLVRIKEKKEARRRGDVL